MSNPNSGEGISPSERRAGFLIGAVVGSTLAAQTAQYPDAAEIRTRVGAGEFAMPLPPPEGTRRAATALPDALMEELLSGGVDLRRLAQRWLSWWRENGEDIDPRLALSLSHLRDFDAPLPPPAVASLAPVAAALPAALTFASPQGMVAGAFHVAALLDPTEEAALSAVAMVLAAARLLEGRRDFVPDVVAVLRANDAQDYLIDGVRNIPKDPRTPPPIPRGDEAGPAMAMHWVLWQLHHRPRAVDCLNAMALAGGISPYVGSLLGALLGARDGLDGWPELWLTESGEEVVLRRALAGRLG